MRKILEKFMKKYWKNAKKNWKSQGNSSVQKSGNHALYGLEVKISQELYEYFIFC